jgi:hypothetical protein
MTKSSARTVQGLTYRMWQKRNSERFSQLLRFEKKKARERGYRNVGWGNVIAAYQILIDLVDEALAMFVSSENPASTIDELVNAEHAQKRQELGLDGYLQWADQQMEAIHLMALDICSNGWAEETVEQFVSDGVIHVDFAEHRLTKDASKAIRTNMVRS